MVHHVLLEKKSLYMIIIYQIKTYYKKLQLVQFLQINTNENKYDLRLLGGLFYFMENGKVMIDLISKNKNEKHISSLNSNATVPVIVF
jgi:hypothetical protein